MTYRVLRLLLSFESNEGRRFELFCSMTTGGSAERGRGGEGVAERLSSLAWGAESRLVPTSSEKKSLVRRVKRMKPSPKLETR